LDGDHRGDAGEGGNEENLLDHNGYRNFAFCSGKNRAGGRPRYAAGQSAISGQSLLSRRLICGMAADIIARNISLQLQAKANRSSAFFVTFFSAEEAPRQPEVPNQTAEHFTFRTTGLIA
jgi:hypothetical protein